MYEIARKTVVITGASSGIGRAAASAFAAADARLVLLGRNAARLDEVAARTGATAIRCDFEDFSSVRDAAKQISDLTPHIDVLLNNAGAFYRKYELTIDGNEKTLQVNTLSPYLLTRQLLPALAAAPRPRVVFTSSQLHRFGRSRLPDPNSPDHFNGNEFRQGTYADSKLFAAALTHGFAARRRDIEFANFHPGTVHTEISRTMPVVKLLQRTPLRRALTITAEESAASLVEVVTSAARYDATYFKRAQPSSPSEDVLDTALAEQFWQAAAAITGETAEL